VREPLAQRYVLPLYGQVVAQDADTADIPERDWMKSHPATRAYVARRTEEGLSKKEIIRCLERYAARQVYPRLRAPAG
jgi:hypothetical protein